MQVRKNIHSRFPGRFIHAETKDAHKYTQNMSLYTYIVTTE